MANEADSRDTTTLPRWGETAGGASVSANVVEPASGKKNTGWLPGAEGIVGEWWNWLAWAAGVFFRYIENFLTLGVAYNHVMAEAANTEGVITDGVGLSVNVSSARCWLNGGMYKVPAAVNLALAAADPSNPRLDLVYARTTGSPAVSSYAVVTGTPSGAPVVPALPAGGCAIGSVRVLAAGVAPSTKASLREFGGIQIDRVIARKRIDVGNIGATPAVTIRDTAGLLIGDPSDPTFWAIPGDFIQLDPALFGYKGGATVTKKYDVDAAEIYVSQDAIDAGDLTRSSSSGLITIKTGGLAAVYVGVRVPKGSRITGVSAYGTKPSTGDGISIELHSRAKGDGTNTTLVSVNNTGVGSGDFTLTGTLSHLVSQDATYFVRVARPGGSGSGDVDLYSVEVEYDELNPFESF